MTTPMTSEELCEHARAELQLKLFDVTLITKVTLQPATDRADASWLRVCFTPDKYGDCILEMPAERLLDDTLITAIADSIRQSLRP